MKILSWIDRVLSGFRWYRRRRGDHWLWVYDLEPPGGCRWVKEGAIAIREDCTKVVLMSESYFKGKAGLIWVGFPEEIMRMIEAKDKANWPTHES